MGSLRNVDEDGVKRQTEAAVDALPPLYTRDGEMANRSLQPGSARRQRQCILGDEAQVQRRIDASCTCWPGSRS
jgi:hypothetical protein